MRGDPGGAGEGGDGVSIRIINGDCLDEMRKLPPASVNCCVTSPPYWGLRDYNVAGQLGLEPTPQEYVDQMVAVFREVRRTLRDDGTLWLNLGSSYVRAAESKVPQTKKGGAPFYPEHSKTGSSDGAVGRGDRPGSRNGACGDTRTIQSLAGVLACGSDGITLQDSPAPDSACSDLCDGCRAALSMGSASTSPPLASIASQPLPTNRDTGHQDCAQASPGASLPGAQVSTISESSSPPSAVCSHCANCGACLSVLRSSTRDARLCARMAESKNGNGPLALAGRNQGKDASGMAWVNYTFKPKNMVPIPWMVAMALQADGWYLRQDIIWAKPNPMPESVRDRCTKSHEYLFLLAKSEKYYCDMDAIKEDCVQDESRPSFRGGAYCNNSTFDNSEGGKSTDVGNVRRSWNGSEFHTGKTGEHQLGRSQKVRSPAGWQTGPGAHGSIHNKGREQDVTYAEIDGSRRNKRSVWTVATQPFSEAHFATFPPALIEPCILAGCPVGGTVLDPFGGAGTGGLVADRLQRNAILIELNPTYAAMAEKRITGDCPMFAEIAA